MRNNLFTHPHTQRQPPAADPFADKTVYRDNALDKFFIKLYSDKMAAQLSGVSVPQEATYDDFVRVSKEIMRGRGSKEQREVVREVLRSLMPREAPAAFRCVARRDRRGGGLRAGQEAVGWGRSGERERSGG